MILDDPVMEPPMLNVMPPISAECSLRMYFSHGQLVLSSSQFRISDVIASRSALIRH